MINTFTEIYQKNISPQVGLIYVSFGPDQQLMAEKEECLMKQLTIACGLDTNIIIIATCWTCSEKKLVSSGLMQMNYHVNYVSQKTLTPVVGVLVYRFKFSKRLPTDFLDRHFGC